jgi:PAS domain S-box-containing protein
MDVAASTCSVVSKRTRFIMPFQNTIVRYLFGIVAVVITYALGVWLIPWTGTDAPSVLFFAAILATSLFAGIGPGICAVLLSLPLAAYAFVSRAQDHLFDAAVQSLLFAIEASVVVYLTFLMHKGREALQAANLQLRSANEEIMRSEARTREVIELAPDAFFQADLDARFTDVNQAACRLLGYDRRELVGKTIFDIIPPEDAPRLTSVRADLLAPGRVDRSEWNLIRKDGALAPVEVSANILSDGRWQAFVRDISRRKRNEDERQVFVSFLENSPDFIGIADPHGKPVYLNPAGRRMVGLPADYPIENTQIPEYYAPDQRAFATDVIVRSMIEQGRWHGETYLHHWQTQEAIPVSDEHFMIRSPETGRVLGMGTIIRDISEIRRVESQLRFLAEVGALLGASLEYEDTLVNIAQVACRDLADLCIIDVVQEDGKAARLKVMGRDPSLAELCDLFMRVPLEGNRPYWFQMVVENKRPILMEHLSAEMIESFSQDESDLQTIRAAGFRSAIAVPLLKDGRLVAAIVLFSASRDYGPTDLNLAAEVAHRAALSIENARLFFEAQRAVKTREDVLAIVSHDLKSPLATIELAVTLLRGFRDLDESQVQEFVNKMQRAADQMEVLIADLLDFARIQSGTFTVVASVHRLNEAVMPAIDRLRTLADAKRQTLEVDLPSSLPAVAVDALRVGQVVSNLVGNAIKFTPHGGAIRISAREQHHRIVVSVADTGPGIPQEYLAKIFDRFWQTPGTKQKGTGLGLSISKGIVEAHGGAIWAVSQTGEGSSFFFTLPLADPPAEIFVPEGDFH